MSGSEVAGILLTVIHSIFNLLRGRNNKISCREIERMSHRVKSKLRRGFTSTDDYLEYINLNFRVFKMLKKIKKLSVTLRGNMFRCLLDDLNRIYFNAVKRFPQEKQLLLSYVEFAEKFHYNGGVKTLIEQLLYNQSSTTKLYEFAITWLIRDMNLAEKSRDVLLHGVEKFSSSETLYLKAFSLELDCTKGVEEKKNNDAESVGLENAAIMEQKEERDNEQMNLAACPDDLLTVCSKNALQVFNIAMNTNPSVHLAYKFLNIARDYHSLHEVEDSILMYILKSSPFDEAAWVLFIKHELRDLYPSQFLDTKATPKYSLEKRIKWCYEVFQRALKVANTENMWTNFIDICMKLHFDETLMPAFEHRLLIKALEDANKEGNLSGKFYLMWVLEVRKLKGKFLPSQDDPEGKPQRKIEKIKEILQSAVNKVPTNLRLRKELLRFYIRHNMEKEIIMALQDAAVRIGDKNKMCELLELCLQYYELFNISKAEELYKKAIECTSAVAEHFKPKYLDWVALRRGIDGARRVYDEYATKPPFCLEFHMTMLSYENKLLSSPQVKSNIRQCFENMCFQFGKLNHGVWINYIKYETGEGETEYVQNLIKRAKEILHPNHLENFKEDLSTLGLGFN